MRGLWGLHSFTYIWFVSLTWAPAKAFVPGLGSAVYKAGDPIDIKVNGLTSIKTQLPYSYYYLPFCRPKQITSHLETLGEILVGETIENSDYEAHMLKPQFCKKLCDVTLGPRDTARVVQLIDDEYTAQWLADGLPAVFPHPSRFTAHQQRDFEADWYSLGFPIGWSEYNPLTYTTRHFLYNYLSIIFKYRPVEGPKHGSRLRSDQGAAAEAEDGDESSHQGYQIVGFEVVPISYFNAAATSESDYCEALRPSLDERGQAQSAVEESYLARRLPSSQFLEIKEGKTFPILYDVKFQLSTIDFSQRWDTYLMSQRSAGSAAAAAAMEIHWFSIVNSLLVVLVLSGIVAMILIRTLHRDIMRYNEFVLNADDEGEETGWKLIHGDVFRKPPHSTVLAALVGSGVQVLSMVLVTLAIAAIGVGLYPATGFGKGRLLQAAVILWSFMGILGGYTAARFYKLFQSPNWKMTTIRTALMYPGFVFTVFFIINTFMWFSGSSAAVPFSAIFLLTSIWLGISAPLVFVGAYLGFRQPSISIPVRVNKIPRQIPAQSWTVNPLVLCLAGGALPFGAVFTELMFVFSSIWQHRTYMLFGLLLLVALILVITSAEIAITMTYFQLVAENYCWWWRSFFVPGSSGFYVLAYALVYWSSKLSLSYISSIVLYLGYSILIAYTFTVLTGTVGFIACFIFVRAIYGSIRVD